MSDVATMIDREAGKVPSDEKESYGLAAPAAVAEEYTRAPVYDQPDPPKPTAPGPKPKAPRQPRTPKPQVSEQARAEAAEDAGAVAAEPVEGEPVAEVTEPVAPAAEPSPAGTEGEAADDFSADLIGEAAALGLDRADFDTPAQMQRAIGAVDRTLAKLGRQGAKDSETQPAAPAAKKAPEPPPKAAPERTAAAESGEDFQVTLDPERFEPEIISEFNRLNKFHNDRFEKLQSQLAGVVGSLGSQQATEAISTLDNFVGGLGSEWESVFGKGDFQAIRTNADALGNRAKLDREAAAIAAGYRVSGLPIPPAATLLKKALGAAFSDQIKTSAQRKLAADVKGRKSQFTSRPTQRSGNSQALSPEETATANARKKLREWGAVGGEE